MLRVLGVFFGLFGRGLDGGVFGLFGVAGDFARVLGFAFWCHG